MHFTTSPREVPAAAPTQRQGRRTGTTVSGSAAGGAARASDKTLTVVASSRSKLVVLPPSPQVLWDLYVITRLCKT